MVWVSFFFFSLPIIGKLRWNFVFYKKIFFICIIYIDTCLSCHENTLEEFSLSGLRQTSLWRKLTRITESCHPSCHPKFTVLSFITSAYLGDFQQREKKVSWDGVSKQHLEGQGERQFDSSVNIRKCTDEANLSLFGPLQYGKTRP